MDNISLFPEEFLSGLKSINNILLNKNELNNKISKISSLSNIDISFLKNEINNLFNEIDELNRRLLVIKNIMMKMDPNISAYYRGKDILGDNENSNEKMLDELKSSNGSVESDKSLNTSGILDMLKNRDTVNLVLDNLKNNGSTGADTSLNVTSILNKEM